MKLDTTLFTWPSSPLLTISCARWRAGWNLQEGVRRDYVISRSQVMQREWVETNVLWRASRATRPFLWASANSCLASAAVLVMGFSTSTCLLACRARIAHSKWRPLGNWICR